MNEAERKERIRNLWGKVRKSVLLSKFIFASKEQADRKAHNTMSGYDFEDVDLDMLDGGQKVKHFKWYFIKTSNMIPQMWDFIINTCTIYALFTTPFILVWPHLYHHVRDFELIIDVLFALEIIMTPFKVPEGVSHPNLKQNALSYFKGFFIFDCLAALPGLVTLENQTVNYMKMFRLVHWNRFFKQLNFIFDKVLLNWLGYNRQKVQELIDFIKLQIFVVYMTHNMACVWVYIGIQTPESWVYQYGFTLYDNFALYVHSFYFILTTITTVGYGDITGFTKEEYIYCMFIEFIGLSFFSFQMGSVNHMLSGTTKFEQIINEHLENLDLWL